MTDVEPLAPEGAPYVRPSTPVDPDAAERAHPVVDSMLEGIRKRDDVDLGRRYAGAGKLIRLGYVVLIVLVFGGGYLYMATRVNERTLAAQRRVEEAMRRAQEEDPYAGPGSASYSSPGPGGLSARAEEQACFSAQEEVEGAMAVWEYENGRAGARSWSALMADLRGRIREPRCPSGGRYAIDSTGHVTCSTHGSLWKDGR